MQTRKEYKVTSYQTIVIKINKLHKTLIWVVTKIGQYMQWTWSDRDFYNK